MLTLISLASSPVNMAPAQPIAIGQSTKRFLAELAASTPDASTLSERHEAQHGAPSESFRHSFMWGWRAEVIYLVLLMLVLVVLAFVIMGFITLLIDVAFPNMFMGQLERDAQQPRRATELARTESDGHSRHTLYYDAGDPEEVGLGCDERAVAAARSAGVSEDDDGSSYVEIGEETEELPMDYRLRVVRWLNSMERSTQNLTGAV